MNQWLLALCLVLVPLYVTQMSSGWRALMLLIIPVGFIQEPVRKLMAGQPVVMQLSVVAIFGLAFLAAAARHGAPTLTPLAGRNKNTQTVLTFFIALALIQSFHSLIRFGTPLVPMLGLVSYLLPIPALWVAWVFARGTGDMRRFLMLYMLSAAVTTVSVVASYYGADIPLFKQIGDFPLFAYHPIAGIVELHCGYLRAPEVAAWHAAAAVCAAITVALAFKGALVRALVPVIVISSLYTIILTGRRKALVIVAIYGVIYLAGLLMARKGSSRVAALAAIGVGLALTVGILVMAPESVGPNPHFDRGATTVGDLWERFSVLGLETILWAYNAGGLLGLGTGAGAQGLQHLAGEEFLQGSAEGGLGRIMVELGLPGLILAVACGIAVARTVRQCISQAYRHSEEMFKLQLGLAAFVGANVPIFVGAAQIFGDPFVLMILGVNLGFILAVPRIVAAGVQPVSQHVRTKLGVPILSDFASGEGTPIIDVTTGIGYYLWRNQVMQLGGQSDAVPDLQADAKEEPASKVVEPTPTADPSKPEA